MRSNSETGYGARIGNAEKLVAALQNFKNYQAIKPEFSITSYTDLSTPLKRKTLQSLQKNKPTL